MKRYEMTATSSGRVIPIRSEDGKWIHIDDVKALETINQELVETLEDLLHGRLTDYHEWAHLARAVIAKWRGTACRAQEITPTEATP